MGKILSLTGFHVAQKLKKPAWWLVSVLLPLLMIVALGLGFAAFFEDGLWLDPFEVILINQDNHPVIQMVESQLLMDEQIGRLVTLTATHSESEALERLQQNEVAAVVILPEGLISALEAGENREIRLLMNHRYPFEGRMIRGIMEHFMKSVSGGQSAVYTVWYYFGELGMDDGIRNQKINPVIQDITLRAYRTRDQLMKPLVLPDLKSMDPFHYYGTAMLVLFVMFLSLQESRLWLMERKQGVSSRILLSGMSGSAYLSVQFLRILLLAILQTLLITMILLVFRVTSPVHLRDLFLLYGGMLFLVSSFALLMGLVVRNEEGYQMILNSVLLLGALLGGGLIPLHYMPDWLQRISLLTVHYWVLTGSFALLNGQPEQALSIALWLFVLGLVPLIISSWFVGKNQEVLR